MSNEIKTIEFEVKPKDLAFVGLNHKWVTESGWFEVKVGGLSKRFYLN